MPSRVLLAFLPDTIVSAIVLQSGLCRTVRNLSWLAAADWRDFFPRCYDLGDKDDRSVALLSPLLC